MAFIIDGKKISENIRQELKEEVTNLCSEYSKATYFVDTDILKCSALC